MPRYVWVYPKHKQDQNIKKKKKSKYERVLVKIDE